MELPKKLWVLPLIAILAGGTVLAAAAGEKVKQVDAKYVCFVTLKKFDKPLTPTVIEGRKYYGCCDDCAKTLNTDPNSRIAVDPVTNKEVDKAMAVIGVDKAGHVYFFENETNLKTFRVPPAK
ncbi:MAG TPA: hypothetical protein VEF06_13990 [Bryobacteraceae bacterium]|nr:hypothetical protein [Bryobacteraceae bacterium]